MASRLSESSLISRYLAVHTGEGGKGLLDDTAFLPGLPADSRYAVSLDTMVEGVHIFKDSSASDWANRLLSANLSDMAAQSARPLGLLVSLSLPVGRAESFIAEFAPEFARGCRANDLQWLGGDLTSSPAGICASATIFGAVKNGIDPRRANAREGDALLVSGELGLSALGLFALDNNIDINVDRGLDNGLLERAISRYKQPVARWREALRIGLAVRAMMDLSDGLVSDLGKLCEASGLGAEVWLDRLPVIAGIDEGDLGEFGEGERGFFGNKQSSEEGEISPSSISTAMRFALTGGEDFELLLSAPLENVDAIREGFAPIIITQIGIMVSNSGSNTSGAGVRYLDARGERVRYPDLLRGYDHFRD